MGKENEESTICDDDIFDHVVHVECGESTPIHHRQDDEGLRTFSEESVQGNEVNPVCKNKGMRRSKVHTAKSAVSDSDHGHAASDQNV